MKKIKFDRYGKCPICHRVFRSEECPHTYSYVKEVVQAANSNFIKDVEKLRARK